MKQICKNGHDTFVVGRVGGKGTCRACHRATDLLIKKINPQKGTWRPSKEVGRSNGWRQNGFLNKEGNPFTLNDYNRLFQIQGGRCKICNKHQSEFEKALAADHNHITRKVRGLLCMPCNIRIGFKEKEEFKDADAKYLQE